MRKGWWRKGGAIAGTVIAQYSSAHLEMPQEPLELGTFVVSLNSNHEVGDLGCLGLRQLGYSGSGLNHGVWSHAYTMHQSSRHFR